MDTLTTFAKENVPLISLIIGIFGVLISIISLHHEIKRKRKRKKNDEQ